MEYDIKAIPTVYAGVRFRSRLEARWAAFFSLSGWEWEYEPLLYPGWIPDFGIKTSRSTIYCEVKPIIVSVQDSHLRRVFAKAVRTFPTALLGEFPEAVSYLDDGSPVFDLHGEEAGLGLICQGGTMRPWLCDLDFESTMHRWKRACQKINTSRKRRPR